MKISRGKNHNEGFRSTRRPQMLHTEAIQRIRILSERNLGAKAIAKATGLARNTVRKYLEHIRQGVPIATTVHRPSKLDPYKEQIHSWFLSCRGHCPVVQRKIQHQLNISVSLRMLQKYCRQWRTKDLPQTEMTQRYEVPPGDEMQIDFGFDHILLNGHRTRICFFVAVLSYSRRIFVKAYPAEIQSAWFDGIESAFKYFSGIPVAVVSDNTRCLVDGRKENGQSQFNRRYLQLARYWQFVPVNCKPYRAKTKGKVERMVGYVKTSCLSGLIAKDWKDLQQQIDLWITTVADVRQIDGLVGRPIDRFETEILALKPYAGPRLGQLRIEIRTIDVSGRIQIDAVRYRIPGTDAGTTVDVIVDQETILVYLHSQCIQKLNRTADVFEASIFKHKRKGPWEVGPIKSSSLDRPLKDYDRFIEENSHARC